MKLNIGRVGLLGLILLLAGCGFHLQNSFQLPEGVNHVDVQYSSARSAERPPVVKALRQKLRQAGVLGDGGAEAVIVIKSASQSKQMIAVSPIDGGAAEYAAYTEVTYDYIVHGKKRVSGEKLKARRYYSYSDVSKLASDAENKELGQAMQKQIAEQILFNINQL